METKDPLIPRYKAILGALDALRETAQHTSNTQGSWESDRELCLRIKNYVDATKKDVEAAVSQRLLAEWKS